MHLPYLHTTSWFMHKSKVAVMGHIGLTPQAISVIGGFRAQGRTATRAREMIDEALRLQDAGAFAVVLECVPANVAKAVTDTLEIPTIGIGAGNSTSGQVLVYREYHISVFLAHEHNFVYIFQVAKKIHCHNLHICYTLSDDMLGMMSHPHHEEFMPKFCKSYAQVGHAITEGLDAFKKDVESGEFPSEEYSPYIMTDVEKALFDRLLEKDSAERVQKQKDAEKKSEQGDEYEQLSLYGGKE